MTVSVEELRKDLEQAKRDGKDGLKEAFLFLEMALTNYQQTLQQQGDLEEDEAILNGFQNLTKKEETKKGRKMKDLRFKKTFKKEKNMVQNQYNDTKQKRKETQQRREASKAEVRRRGGRKVCGGKKEREKMEKSNKVLKLNGNKGIFFRDKG